MKCLARIGVDAEHDCPRLGKCQAEREANIAQADYCHVVGLNPIDAACGGRGSILRQTPGKCVDWQAGGAGVGCF